MAADLRLVADPADRQPFELPPQRPGDRAAERGLADARRADEAQDRAPRVGLQPADGQELEDPVLDLVDVVVVLVEDLAGVPEIEIVLGGLVPRQRRDPLEVAADHAPLRHRRLEPLEPGQLAVGLLADLLGELDRRQLLAQLVDLGLDLVGLAELLLDRLELLAQEVLALALVELGLDLGLDLRAERHHLELAGQDLRQAPQPLGHVDLLEQLLLLLGREPQRAGDQVGRGRWGPSTLATITWSSSGRYGTCSTMSVNVCWTLRISAVSSGVCLTTSGAAADLRDQIRLGPDPAFDPDALATLDQHPQRPVRHADHPRDDAEHAHRVQILGRRRLDVGRAAGDHRDRPVSAQHLVDQLDASLLTDVQRDQHVRERDRVAQRQHADALGQLARAGHGHLPGAAVGDADLDHASLLSIDTGPRARRWTSGSSIRSIPSS